MNQLDWTATINALRETVPHAQFQNWLKPLKLIRSNDQSIVLGVPNRFHEEWIVNHYAGELSKAIRRSTGSEFQLEFEIFVENENVIASQSENLETSAPKIPPGRPALRIVEGMGESPAHEEAEIPTAPPAVDTPNLPQYATPFWELAFNRVASQCASILIEGKSVPMNSFVVLAGVGMGKTHLLSDLGNNILQRFPKARVRYTHSESFTEEMVAGFRDNSIQEFKHKYRQQTDILLFDNVQGLAKRTRSQEELLHIYNDIVSRGGQVVFTSSVAPNQIENIIEPLRSRLLASVIAEIQNPNFEERVELLNKQCGHSQIQVDEPLLRALADRGQKDIRELLGSVIRLHLQAKIENRTFDLAFLEDKGWQIQVTKEQVTMEQIISLVEKTFAVGREELISKSRKSNVTWARQVAMYLARHYTLYPLEKIGELFGRDHATVIHSFSKVAEVVKQHPARRFELEFLQQKLSARTADNAGPSSDL